MRAREQHARGVVIVIACGVFLGMACAEKKKPPPAANPYQVGSLVINLPPSVSVPLPQGRPDEPGVNQVKCNYVVDKKIDFMIKQHPEYKASAAQAKPSIMQECLTKWTQPQYDCMIAAKALEPMIMCHRFQRP